ncbi:MAG: hypothetical protein ACU826_08145 [Gammaproteobacteria bacterium]
MFQIVKLFADICLFKKGPQHLPYSIWFYRFTILIYAFVNLLVLGMSMSWRNAVMHLIAEIVLVLGFVFILLLPGRKLARFHQTAAAMFGTDALISFFAIPALATMKTGQMPGVTYPVVLGLLIWHWGVIGHIFRHALSASLSFSLGLAFLFIIGSIYALSFIG